MKSHTLAACLVAMLLRSSLAGELSPRERVSIDDHWRFKMGDTREETNLAYGAIKPWILPAGDDFIGDRAHRFARPAGNIGGGIPYAQPGFDDSSWQLVNLPHDWAIAGPFTTNGGGGMGRLPTAGVGWYRKTLRIPKADAGKRIYLDVDGAMSYAAVWLNGTIVGGWPYGYASWELDLTPYVKAGGENMLVIRLDNLPNSSRWYPGAGIYRNVWLVETAPVHVAHWGTRVTTPKVSAASATVNLAVSVKNDSSNRVRAEISTQVFSLDSRGRKSRRPAAMIAPLEREIESGGRCVAEGECVIDSPRLWGPPPSQQPNRYVAVTTVSCQGHVTDVYETPFGVRTLRFDPNEGFFINGERTLMNGVCDHHDLGALGAALNGRALRRQLEMLQEMGCNAIRTSHNPPAPEFLELTDEMGFLVMDEAFDVWERQKTPFDFHLIFPEWHEPELRAQIRRDRNSPSVVLWSIGNEVGEQYTDTNGAALGRALCGIVREEDTTRPITSAMNWAQPTNALPAVLDVIGLNYQGAGIRGAPGKYPAFHERFPEKMIVGSETA